MQVNVVMGRLGRTFPTALLFDLGRVVIDIDFDRVYRHWAAAAGCDAAPIKARMAFDHQHERFERREIEAADWFQHLRRLLGIEISDADFLAGWNDIFVGEVPGIAELLSAAGRRLPLYALTNTNRIHVAHWSAGRFDNVLRHFRHIFASSTIGLRKPDRAVFDHVAREIGVSHERILFFDDVAENVEGARAAGLEAIQVRSIEDVRRALTPLTG